MLQQTEAQTSCDVLPLWCAQFKPGSWLAIGHQLIDADAGAMDLMDKHGVPRLDAEELYGVNLLADVSSASCTGGNVCI